MIQDCGNELRGRYIEARTRRPRKPNVIEIRKALRIGETKATARADECSTAPGCR